MRRLVLLLPLLLLAGCGGGSGGQLRVDAAASLTDVFRQLDPKASFEFAGSDQLAFQLEQGAKADVYASASPKYPQKLYVEKLVEQPRAFATNSLVLIVPRGDPGQVTGLGSLLDPAVKLVEGAKGVPVGDYTRKVLASYCGRVRLPPGAKCPAARVVSEEQDVKGVVAKVALGEADAGFAYVTDVQAAGGKVRAIALDPILQPTVSYQLAVVRGAKHREAAERFVALVTGPRGRAALKAAGFGLP
jgi:molybdate transport system substrate-binding protein